MTLSPETTAALDRTWRNPPGFSGWLRAVNQTNIGRRYLFTSLIFLLAGGALALLMRAQLGTAQSGVISPGLYNRAFSMHGITMMFLFVIPVVEGLGIYLVPLMIGTRDLSFPRLSAFSYFVFLIGGATLWVGFFAGVAPDAGWFSYAPLSLKPFSPGYGIDIYATVITFIEISALAAAVELTVTILRQRAPGMSLTRMPPFVWSILVTAIMIIFAMPGVITGSVMLATDRIFNTAFFDHARGGDSLLWQHLFWWFGHPEVYIALLPATGVISTVIPVFSRRPLFGYTAVIVSIVTTGIISFGLWVHHMFTTGLPVHASSFFAAASAMVALPTGVQVFCWIATIWLGRPSYKTPMLFACAFIFLVVLGGLTGIMVASIPFDKQVHDSYFVVAHLHYILIGGVLFPVLGAFYYWWPKLTGKLLSEKLGKWNFWLTFAGLHVTFFPMHFLGFQGMPRRIYTYLPETGWEPLNLLVTAGAFLLGAGFLVLVINIALTTFRGNPAGKNPWQADTLEWHADSPPASYNFAEIPRVESMHPLWHEGDALKPAVTGMRTDRREILITSAAEADLLAVADLPSPTIWPLLTAAGTATAFVGLIFDPWWFVGGFFAVFVAATFWFAPAKSWRKEAAND